MFAASRENFRKLFCSLLPILLPQQSIMQDWNCFFITFIYHKPYWSLRYCWKLLVKFISNKVSWRHLVWSQLSKFSSHHLFYRDEKWCFSQRIFQQITRPWKEINWFCKESLCFLLMSYSCHESTVVQIRSNRVPSNCA